MCWNKKRGTYVFACLKASGILVLGSIELISHSKKSRILLTEQIWLWRCCTFWHYITLGWSLMGFCHVKYQPCPSFHGTVIYTLVWDESYSSISYESISWVQQFWSCDVYDVHYFWSRYNRKFSCRYWIQIPSSFFIFNNKGW